MKTFTHTIDNALVEAFIQNPEYHNALSPDAIDALFEQFAVSAIYLRAVTRNEDMLVQDILHGKPGAKQTPKYTYASIFTDDEQSMFALRKPPADKSGGRTWNSTLQHQRKFQQMAHGRVIHISGSRWGFICTADGFYAEWWR